jgi:hypothetical protein
MNKNKKPWIFGAVLVLFLPCSQDGRKTDSGNALPIPEEIQSYVAAVEWDDLGRGKIVPVVQKLDAGTFHVRLDFDGIDPVSQDDWQVRVHPAFEPDFHWAPHLTPKPENIMDQHVFRSPALIVGDGEKLLTLVPDLDIMGRGTPARWYMDLDAPSNVLTLGMSDCEVMRGLFFVRKPGATYPAGKHAYGFYVFVSDDKEDIHNPWRRPLSFLWERWGKALFESGQPLPPDLEHYVRHTYTWAFNTWAKSVWQEFDIDGKKVGAPVFIVNVTQSPNYPGEINEREFRSIWNQAWFSSLRSASGLYRYARRTQAKDLLAKALLTKELALAAPQKMGFFDTVVATEMEMVKIGEKEYNRSKGWGTLFWGNSDRNPVNRPAGEPRNRDAGIAPYHILDMSWTALLMLRWYEELEKEDRLLEYAQTYADHLLDFQDEAGYFPGWLDKETLQPLGILDRSPETSMSVTFLLKLGELTGERKYKQAAFDALEAIIREVIPAGRWEDFETYWSSSSYGSGDLIGTKVARNNMFKQCNFSMFWTTEALYEAYKISGEKRYLEYGQRVLDELLMTQASWQPPYMYVDVLGGFGVMNCDGEWLDSRQNLFAEVIVRYGQELEMAEYIQRGLAALRASFVMMYCPENPKTKIQWEKRHPFFGSEDYGFTMENYGHGGRTSPEGEGMGVFTIYDWGNGAAAEAYNRMLDHFGPEFLSQTKEMKEEK